MFPRRMAFFSGSDVDEWQKGMKYQGKIWISIETTEQHVTSKINFDMFHDLDKAAKNEFFSTETSREIIKVRYNFKN